MNTVKNRLLTAMAVKPITVVLFGGEYDIKRLTAARLSEHDKKLSQAQSANDSEALAKAHAQLVLDSIIDGDGLAADSTSAQELMASHSHMDIIDAAKVIISANFGLEGAIDTAKNS